MEGYLVKAALTFLQESNGKSRKEALADKLRVISKQKVPALNNDQTEAKILSLIDDLVYINYIRIIDDPQFETYQITQLGIECISPPGINVVKTETVNDQQKAINEKKLQDSGPGVDVSKKQDADSGNLRIPWDEIFVFGIIIVVAIIVYKLLAWAFDFVETYYYSILLIAVLGFVIYEIFSKKNKSK